MAPAVVSNLLIPVFAGQDTVTAKTHQAHDQALRDASSPSGSTLLSACHEAFVSELSTLTSQELKESAINLFDFRNAQTLLELPHIRYGHNPIISGSSHFLFQMLKYLAYVEYTMESSGSFTPFSDIMQLNTMHGTGVLGFSSGILPAVVVSTSLNLSSFLSRVVEIYRLVIWIGIRVQAYRQKTLAMVSALETPSSPWNLVYTGPERETISQAVAAFNKKLDDHCIFITAIMNATCVTVSGRPDHLLAFATEFSSNAIVHKTNLDALYHVPSLLGVRNSILADVVSRKIKFPTFSEIRVPIRSTFNGDAITKTSSSGSLVELIVDMLISQPVNWDLVLERTISAVPKDVPVQLLNFGPGRGLMEGLDRSFGRDDISVFDLFASSQFDHNIRDGSKREPIAIVGMAVNMPGASNSETLWGVLETGINTVSEVPKHRFKISDYVSGNNPRRSMKAHTGNFVDNVDEFDNKFFKISPREAKSLDPQQRILLHAAYEALEDAGYVPYATPTFNPETFGCYIGVATHDYLQNLRNDIDVYYSTGTLKAFLSGRISYALQLSGPSVVVDTACSSSAVALYQGCRALVNGDCNAALVGGVNVICSPDMMLGLDRGHFLSSTGQCKAFDVSADGYSRSEGVGVFVLKRLCDAIAESDNILGVIRAIEVNQSGLAHSITHLHAPTQTNLFRRVIDVAGVNPHDINVIEAHGTGTQAGDPNELESIRSVFAQQRPANNPLHVTSVKSNVGHLGAASGAAGLAKLILMLRHKTIPRVISLKTLNPRIADLSTNNIIIDTAPTAWLPPTEDMPRFALLNNFGAAGSNVAILLEEHLPSIPKTSPTSISYVFGISAKDSATLETLRVRFIDWLQDPNHSSASLPDIAYTTTARRQMYPHRISVAAASKEELVAKLTNATVSQVEERPFKVAFVFSGQGGQYLGMGRSLYRTVPLFRKMVDECHSILTTAGFPGVLSILLAEGDSSGLLGLEEIEAYQAAIFSLEYALAKLWMSWGIVPTVVVGYSLGEYAALVVANVLTLRGALMLVAHLARYMVQKCVTNATGMIAVNLPSDSALAIIKSSSDFCDITIASYNSSVDCILSGPINQLQALKVHLDVELRCKNAMLSMPFGYHSPAMRPLLDDLTSLAKHITINAPSLPIVTGLFGEVVPPGDSTVFNPEYFARHCAEPVLFAKGIQQLALDKTISPIDAWIEIGPHPMTLPMLKGISEVPKSSLFLSSIRKQQEPWSTLTMSLTRLFGTSASLEWRNVFAHVSAACISIPTYPFTPTKFWVPYEDAQTIQNQPAQHIIQLPTVEYKALHRWAQYPSNENGYVAIFETPITQLAKFIQGHSVAGVSLCPASVYIEQVLAGLHLAYRHLSTPFVGSHFVFKRMEFTKPLVYDDVPRTIITNITIEGDHGTFFVASRNDGTSEEPVHVYGEYRLRIDQKTIDKFSHVLPVVNHRISTLMKPKRGRPPQLFSTRTAYEVIFPRVVNYSKEYHTMHSLAVDTTGMEGYALVRFPHGHDDGKFVTHPVFTDTLLHIAGFVANMQGGPNDAYICSRSGSVKVLPDKIDNGASYAVYCSNGWFEESNIMVAEAYAIKLSEPPTVVAHLKDMHFRKVRLHSLKKGLLHTIGTLRANPLVRSAIPAKASSMRPQPLSQTTLVRTRTSPGTDVRRETTRIVPDSEYSITRPEFAKESTSGSSSPRTLVPLDDDVELNPMIVDGSINVKSLLAAVLDISPKEIDEDANLEALGLDSLTSIEALQALKSEYGLNLPNNFFDDYPTVRKIQSHLISTHSPSKSRTGKLPLYYPTQPENVSPKLPTSEFSVKISPASATRLTKALKLNAIPLQLQRSDSKNLPLFLIHDGSGLINYYHGISSLGRNVWGFNNPKFTTSEPWNDVSEMASAYAHHIAQVTSGPIILGGWSFGGVAAYETSLQLANMGITTKGILLIDSPSPINHVPLSDSLIDSVVNLDSRSANSDLGRLVKAQFAMNARMLGKYDPRATSGSCPPLILLRSCEGFNPTGVTNVPIWLADRSDTKLATAGWENLASGDVRVLDIPGHHFTPFNPKNIKQVSQRMIEGCALIEIA